MSMSETDNSYRIFVSDDEIYYGNFDEVPEKFRDDLKEALDEWGTVLGKSNLNEMIYSLLAWYDQRLYVCNECEEEFSETRNSCDSCGNINIETKYKYERDEKLTRLMLCIGMITHIEIN